MSQLIEMRVPDMGEFKDVAVIEVLVKPGDTVAVETPLVTLETDKATLDVPATAAGVIETVHVKQGGTVNKGDLVVSVRGGDAPGAGAPAPDADSPSVGADQPATPATASAPAPVASAPAATPAAPAAVTPAPAPAVPPAAPVAAASAARSAAAAQIDEAGFSRAHASPSVRKFARELGVDLVRVRGSGLKGRVTADDVKAHVKQALGAGAAAGAAAQGGSALPAVPVVDFAQFGPVEVKPLGRIQKISGARVHASWVNLPHVTQFDEADITELEATRGKLKGKLEKTGVKLTLLAFMVRACVRTLQQFPQFNASLDATRENLVFKKYFHIGFAADTPNGLLVPVVRDADRKDVYEIARALADLSAQARAGKLPGTDMQGGSFTISSLGGIGGTAFTPIINAPEVAILGVSRSIMKPVYRDGGFVPRLMVPLSLSYDHRVIDGALAVRFTTRLAEHLADPQGLLEAVP